MPGFAERVGRIESRRRLLGASTLLVPRQLGHQAVGVDVEAAVHVHDEEGVERLVEGAVFGLGDGVAEVDPVAIGDAVVVVVDVPGADRFPVGDGDLAALTNGIQRR